MLEYNHRKCKGVGSVKKTLAVVFSAFMSIGAGGQGYVLGDVDGNGVIDGTDASLVLSVYAETSVGTDSRLTDSQTLAADADENHIVDGSDASWILSYYAYISVHGGGEMDLRSFVEGEAPTEYYEPEYILENIGCQINDFEMYRGYFNSELLDGNGIECNYGSGGTYGGRESKLVLALLNYRCINDDVIQNALGNFSEQELKDYQNFLYLIAPIKDATGHGVDFTNYTLNQEIGNYLNELQNAGDINDFIYNTWVQGNMPQSCKENPAVAAIVASYDIYHNGSKYLTQEQVDNEILNDAVDNIISKAKGYEYHR